MAGIEPIQTEEVDSKARQAPGAVMLDFCQASCAPCRTLEPRLERVAAQYAGKVPVYRVDIDKDQEIARSFNVMSLPTLLVLKGGKEVIRLDGLIKDQDLKVGVRQRKFRMTIIYRDAVMAIKVEILSAPGCSKCAQAKEALKSVVNDLGQDL